MTNFQQRIKETLARVDPHRDGIDTRDVFVRVLDEFKAALEAEKPFVRVRIERGGHPQMLHLITYPTCRRDERTVMLSLWRDQGTMRVGGEDAVFSSPQELEKYLITFLEKTAFPLTLAWYEKRCTEDVDAFLRIRIDDFAVTSLNPRDVLVVVRASDQWKLATAVPGTELKMVVKQEKLPTTGSYDERAHYPYLSSSGFVMRIGEHRRTTDAEIELTGTVLPEEESAAEDA
jgi:hypothetical protein